MKPSLKDTRGAIGLLTTLVMGFSLLSLAVAVVVNGISSRLNTFNAFQSEKVFISAEGCAENALLLLSRNNNYSGGTFTFQGTDCSVSVGGNGAERDVVVSAEREGISKDIVLRVQVTPPFAIMEWTD